MPHASMEKRQKYFEHFLCCSSAHVVCAKQKFHAELCYQLRIHVNIEVREIHSF
jgi:hypothetical protein